MSRARFIELLAKKESGEITLLEQQEFAQLLAGNEHFSKLADILGSIATSVKPEDENTEAYMEEKWLSLASKIELIESEPVLPDVPKPVFTLKKLLVAASIVAIIYIAGFTFQRWQNNDPRGSENNIFYTKRGSKSNLVLPDGTQVWLNADTKITYGKVFGEKIREVYLEGEAFFDVVKNPSVPFIVHTSTMDVKVLGTAFNVRSYADETSAQTSLIRGAVEIELKEASDKKIQLKPDEKIIIQKESAAQIHDKNENNVTTSPEILITHIKKSLADSAAMETLWVKNKLAFDHMELQAIAQQLERWYDVKIIIEGNQLKHTKFNGTFASEGLEEVLEAFKLTSAVSFSYQTNKNIITIKQK